MQKVLVIDDDEQLRSLVSQILDRAGYHVTEAENGNQGMRLYRANPADLVITDIIMPETEGVETILTLRREYPKIKIIAMSGGGRSQPGDYLTVARRLGARSTIAKPFSREELLTAVRTALDQ